MVKLFYALMVIASFAIGVSAFVMGVIAAFFGELDATLFFGMAWIAALVAYFRFGDLHRKTRES